MFSTFDDRKVTRACLDKICIVIISLRTWWIRVFKSANENFDQICRTFDKSSTKVRQKFEKSSKKVRKKFEKSSIKFVERSTKVRQKFDKSSTKVRQKFNIKIENNKEKAYFGNIPGVPGIVTFIYKNIEPQIF